MTHIKVIIPAYNEADSIAKVINDIPEIVKYYAPQFQSLFSKSEYSL